MTRVSQGPAESTVVMTEDDIRRALSRMAHQVLEQHKGPKELVFLGILTRGLPMAERLVKKIGEMEGETPRVAGLDILPYRDDMAAPGFRRNGGPALGVEVADKKVIIVDDVLFTGRSARAALDALTDAGRPRQVQLAVLVDRGHRELPIRADYVGKNMPTAIGERIQVKLEEVDGRDEVALFRAAGR